MATTRAAVISADMPDIMQQDAVDLAGEAMDRYFYESHIAAYIGKRFKGKYPGTWHCIVGSEFGTSITMESCSFIHFILGHFAFVLFKSELD